MEQGRRLNSQDLEKAGQDSKYLTWAPFFKRYGFLSQDVFRHMGVVRGIGVGGGSLVYAAVLLEPKDNFYQDPAWSNLSQDWKTELRPFYKIANKMLGVTLNPYKDIQDQWLKQTAREMNVESSYDTVPQGIYFGNPEHEVEDPLLDGKGPNRKGCNRCGKCITGCAQGAKNSLDHNYLYLAEKLGVQIIPESQVTHLAVIDQEKGYIVHRKHPWLKETQISLKAKKVILSAGVIGTLEILFSSRDVYKTLPHLSDQLGEHVRTNSEAVVSILSKDHEIDLTQGTTISSHFYPDRVTHITQNRFPESYEFMKFYMGPLTNGDVPLIRAIKVLSKFIFQPLVSTLSWRTAQWHKRISVLTVMQQTDNQLKFVYGRSLLSGFRSALKSETTVAKRSPSYIPLANQAAEKFAKVSNGVAQNVLLESIANVSVTAHLLGGAVMASNPKQGVIDSKHQVFWYEGLYVVDGSSIPVNVGVNPSLTITALAERFAAQFIENNLNQSD